MRNAVLELINSYESTISSVEGLIAASYTATATSDDGLDELEEERKKLTRNLQETLARNRSLRRKDFNGFMERFLSVYESNKREIENQRKMAGEMLRAHLEEQKRVTASAKERLISFTQREGATDCLEDIISELKAATQDKGEQVFSQLRYFQRRLEAFRKEQEEMNSKMQRLVDRGASLRLEDLRQLEAAKEKQERKVQLETRREDVGRLLISFSRQRRWSRGR